MEKIIVLILLLMSLVNCGPLGDNSKKRSAEPHWDNSISLFSNCGELDEYLATAINYSNPAATADRATAAPQHFENQVEGVLEGDIVQASEDRFYFVRPTSIEVMEKINLRMVKSIPIPEMTYNKIIYQKGLLFYIGSTGNLTQVIVFDELDGFQVLFEKAFRGSINDFRITEKQLVVVTKSYLSQYEEHENCENIYKPNMYEGSHQISYIYKISFDKNNFKTTSSGILGSSAFIYMTKDELLLFDYGNFRLVRWKEDKPILQQAVQFEGQLKDQYSVYKRNDNLFLAITNFDQYLKSNINYIIAFYLNPLDRNQPYVLASKSEGFGPKEDIRAVQYHGDYAYVVTYEKTDPLFKINLLDPFHIKIISELKVPGFSTQLKELGSNLLVGLGFDTIADQDFSWAAGLKLSLFSNGESNGVKELEFRTWGVRGSYSEATWDPKSFFVSPQLGYAMFPATILQNSDPSVPWSYGSQVEFAGGLVFNFKNNQINEVGRISHSDWRVRQCGEPTSSWGSWWATKTENPDVRRIFISDGDIVAFSNFGATRNDINNLTVKQALQFATTEKQCPFSLIWAE